MIEEQKEIDNVHNPDNMTDGQIGINTGWRLLLKSELNSLGSYCKNDATLEEWDGSKWDLASDWQHSEERTYRTKRPLV
ncbi:MAG TPA: hypothetical protein VJH63_01870 [Candidatus Paceibacterota bacterium]